MPFVNRRVEPLHLSRKALPAGCDTELESVANNTLAGLVRQLADVADHATSIFDGIRAEAGSIFDRSCRLRERADRLQEYLASLDARAVTVPVSTLSDFTALSEHYRYKALVQENLITPASRPQCIELQYCKASTNLKDIFEKLKEYHEDETTVSNLCQSISLSRLNCDVDSSEYDIEFPRPASSDVVEQRRRKALLPYSRLPARPRSEGDLLEDYVPANRGTLPTPEEVMRRNVSQSTVVSVDTSGSGFERMQTFRRSLTAVGRRLERAKKKRWRRTVSGALPDYTQTDSAGEGGGSSSGIGGGTSQTPDSDLDPAAKTMSLDRRSFSRVRPLESSPAAAASVAVATPTRARRRPRSLRLPGPAFFPGLLSWRENHQSAKQQQQQQREREKAGARNRHSVALPIQTSAPTPSPSQGYSSCTDEKAWPGSPRRRPQSLALPPTTGPLPQPLLLPLSPAQPTGKQVYVTSNRSVPDAIIPTTAVTVSIHRRKGSGGDAPRGPLEGVRADTLLPPPRKGEVTVVKLRNAKPMATTKEERQSSSGNWSGTDSARTSMNSELGNVLTYEFLNSTASSPSDSAVSLSSENLSFPKFSGGLKSLERKHSRGKSDRPGAHLYHSAGDSSSGSSTPTNSPNILRAGFTQMDTDSWLQSVGAATERRMPPEAGNVAPAGKNGRSGRGSHGGEVIFTADGFSDSSSSSENAPSSSALSDTSSVDLEVYLADVNSDFVDSDSTSGHSVDHEGYWTSMHSDCGLPSRRSKKRKSSLSREPLALNLAPKQAVPQAHPKRTSVPVAGPVAPKSVGQKKQPPPPPLRMNSSSSTTRNNRHHSSNSEGAGGRQSLNLLLLPLTLSEDNRSVSPSSLTDTASETSTIGSDTTTTPTLTPVQTPTDPAMYKLCFSGISKSLESLDSQLSAASSLGVQPSASVAGSATVDASRRMPQQQQPLSAGARVSVSEIADGPMGPVQEQASVATFRPQLIQTSSSVLPTVSQSRPLTPVTSFGSSSSLSSSAPGSVASSTTTTISIALTKTSPTHEGKMRMLQARNKFFGIARAEGGSGGGSEDLPASPQRTPEAVDGREQEMSRDESEEQVVSPIGVYPETYNTLKRRPKHETDRLSRPASMEEGVNASGSAEVAPPVAPPAADNNNSLAILEDPTEAAGKVTVASHAKKGLDTLQRKRFQDYVSSVQSQAPQSYSAIGGGGGGSGGGGGKDPAQAMTREQREEILNMMRRTKNNRAPASPTLPDAGGKRADDPPPPRQELGRIVENVSSSSSSQGRPEGASADSKTSFRSSYHVGVESENLDPDLAIIRAAQQMEQQILRQRHGGAQPQSPSRPGDPNVWLPNSYQQPFSRNSVAYHSFYDTEMCGNSFSHIPSMASDEGYVYDPDLKPKSSILKVRRQGGSPLNEARVNGGRHQHHHQQPAPSGRPGQTLSPTDSTSSLNSIRSITFSDMVDVERTPVKICLVSGKPQTPIDDFKMLLQQHSGPKRGQSACLALNVKPKQQRGRSNAELLYSGSQADEIAKGPATSSSSSSSSSSFSSSSSSAASRKIVTMKDLRTAMANPRTNSRTSDLGLPYEELQAQNRHRSPRNSPVASPSGTLSKQDKAGSSFDFGRAQDSAPDPGHSDSDRNHSLPNGILPDVAQSSKPSGSGPISTKPQDGSPCKQRPAQPNTNQSNSTASPVAAAAGESPRRRAGDLTEAGRPSENRTGRRPEAAVGSGSPQGRPSKAAPRLTGSASDSALSRRDLMAEIRRRGAHRDSRQEAVEELESQQLQRKLSASSLPSLMTTGCSGGTASVTSPCLGSLLDSMKTALKSMEMPSPTGEEELDSGAWD